MKGGISDLTQRLDRFDIVFGYNLLRQEPA